MNLTYICAFCLSAHLSERFRIFNACLRSSYACVSNRMKNLKFYFVMQFVVVAVLRVPSLLKAHTITCIIKRNIRFVQMFSFCAPLVLSIPAHFSSLHSNCFSHRRRAVFTVSVANSLVQTSFFLLLLLLILNVHRNLIYF